MSRPPPCRKGAGREGRTGDPRLRAGKLMGLLRAEHGELGGRDLLGKQLLVGDRVQPDGGPKLDLIFDLRVFLASVLMRTS